MANTSIPNLDPASTLTGTEEIPAAQGVNDVKITAAQVKTYVLGGRSITEINIGDWDMNTNATVSVTTTILRSKVKDVSAVIINDADSTTLPLDLFLAASGVQGGVNGIFDNSVVLARLTGGTFDNTSYDSTGFNRGVVTIIHEA